MNGGLTITGLDTALRMIEAPVRPAAVDHLAAVAAETFVESTHDWIDGGHAFTPRTGHLEQSITWRPDGEGQAVVSANMAYAGYVEQGTKPHKIKPKPGRKALKIPTGSGYTLVGGVNHPGSKPHPYLYADEANRMNQMTDACTAELAKMIAGAG
jgi:phage gpG-like protein